MQSVIDLFSSFSFEMKLGLTITPLVLCLLKKYFEGGVNRFNADLTNKLVIITGSNTGIGYQTALKLAQSNAKVILACRSEQRGKEAMNKLRLATNNNNIEYMNLDLCDFENIRQFAVNYKQKYDKLDILVNNAGIMMPEHLQMTKDGNELQMQSNHYGHFLLTSLLIDYLGNSKDGRIVNVSSLAHMNGVIDFTNMNSEKPYNPRKQYGLTKLCNILFSDSLSRKYPSITSVSLHPGVVRTELGRFINEYRLVKMLKIPLAIFIGPIFYMLTKSAKGGAQTSLHCCLAPKEELSNGKYYSDCYEKAVDKKAEIYLKEADNLWNHSIEITKAKWN